MCQIPWYLVSSNLSWKDQIDHICKKARKTIGYLHRSFHSAPPQTCRSLYLSLVRPILEYGWTTYHPLNSELTNRLDATQRFASCVILQDWKLTHDDLNLLKADLPLLSKRRDFATLCQLFKIVYKLCSSPNPYNPHPRPGLRNLNSMALDTPFCRLSLTQKSFYPYAPHFGIISLVVQLNAPHSLPSSQPLASCFASFFRSSCCCFQLRFCLRLVFFFLFLRLLFNLVALSALLGFAWHLPELL